MTEKKGNPLWISSEHGEFDDRSSGALQKNPSHAEAQIALIPQVLPPERFDLTVIERDLRQIANSRSLVRQYLTAAKARFRTARQMEVLDALIAATNRTAELFSAQTALAKAEEGRETAVVLRSLSQQVQEAELQTNLAEAKLRRFEAEEKMRPKPAPAPSKPQRQPTPEKRRAQKLANVKALEAERDKVLSTITDEDMRQQVSIRYGQLIQKEVGAM